jgi:hypothetical protein
MAPATSYRTLSPTCRTVRLAGTPSASRAMRKMAGSGLATPATAESTTTPTRTPIAPASGPLDA